MKLNHIISAFALALPLAASAACSSVTVTVLPFEVARDYDTSYATLTEDFDTGQPTLGYVKVQTYALLKGCEVTVGYRNAVLRVARELKRDDCSFQHVLAHEEKHLDIYREALASIAGRIESRAAEPDLFKAVAEEAFAVQVLQQAHDSPEEYATNETACNGRIARLVGFRRR
jgi:hypothetical protein